MGQKIDLSQIVWLRERISRASLATKLAGIQAGLVIAGYLSRLSLLLIFVGFAFAWAGFRLAKGLRRGSEPAAKILTWGLVPYASYALYAVITIFRDPYTFRRFDHKLRPVGHPDLLHLSRPVGHSRFSNSPAVQR